MSIGYMTRLREHGEDLHNRVAELEEQRDALVRFVETFLDEHEPGDVVQERTIREGREALRAAGEKP